MFIKTDLALNSTWQMFLNSADGLFINILASSSAARPTNQPTRQALEDLAACSEAQASARHPVCWRKVGSQCTTACLPRPMTSSLGWMSVGRPYKTEMICYSWLHASASPQRRRWLDNVRRAKINVMVEQLKHNRRRQRIWPCAAAIPPQLRLVGWPEVRSREKFKFRIQFTCRGEIEK